MFIKNNTLVTIRYVRRKDKSLRKCFKDCKLNIYLKKINASRFNISGEKTNHYVNILRIVNIY